MPFFPLVTSEGFKTGGFSFEIILVLPKYFLGGFEGFHGTIHESRNCGFLIVFETPPKHHWKLNVCRWGQYGWIKQVHLWMFLESRAHGNCDLVSIACKETSDLLIDDWEDQERHLFFSQIYWVSQKYQLVCFLKKRYELLAFQVFLGAASKAHANNPSFLSANDEGNCLTQTKFIIEELRAYPSTWCLESARKTWTLHLLTGCYTSFIDPLQKNTPFGELKVFPTSFEARCWVDDSTFFWVGKVGESCCLHG